MAAPLVGEVCLQTSFQKSLFHLFSRDIQTGFLNLSTMTTNKSGLVRREHPPVGGKRQCQLNPTSLSFLADANLFEAEKLSWWQLDSRLCTPDQLPEFEY